MKKKAPKRKTGKSNAGTAKLKKIVAEAKRIYKANPRKKWTSCVKEASKKV